MIEYSFLVPVYNEEKYLERCVDSLLSQDYPNNSYEIVLVDDGSTDRSVEICDNYKNENHNITVVHKENMGLMQARRTGVEASKGQYLIFVDSDDYVDTDMLSRFDPFLKENTPDFLMYSYYRTVDGIDKQVFLANEPYELLTQSQMVKLIAKSDRYNGIAGKIVRSGIIKDHIDEIYEYAVNIGEDKVQTAFLLKYSKKCVLSNICPYHYVIRDDSMIHNKSMEDIHEAVFVYEIVKKLINDVVAMDESLEKEKEKILSGYDAMAIDTVMDHLYKYDIRKDIEKKEKEKKIKDMLREKRSFFEISDAAVEKLSFHNRPRFRMLLSERYRFLIGVDVVLSVIRRFKRRTVAG